MSSGTIVYVTGLPSSGKSTFAEALRLRLREARVPACILDSDALREALVPSPDYGPTGRANVYETLARIGLLLAQQGLVVIIAATANREEYRASAFRLAPRFVEVLIDTPIEVCRERDTKGLYAAYRQGRARHVPGEDEDYERPHGPDVVAKGGHDLDALNQTLTILTSE